MAHHVEKCCVCGVVYRRCRCPGPHEVRWGRCRKHEDVNAFPVQRPAPAPTETINVAAPGGDDWHCPSIFGAPDRTTLLAQMAATIAAGLVTERSMRDGDIEPPYVAQLATSIATCILTEAERRQRTEEG